MHNEDGTSQRHWKVAVLVSNLQDSGNELDRNSASDHSECSTLIEKNGTKQEDNKKKLLYFLTESI